MAEFRAGVDDALTLTFDGALSLTFDGALSLTFDGALSLTFDDALTLTFDGVAAVVAGNRYSDRQARSGRRVTLASRPGS